MMNLPYNIIDENWLEYSYGWCISPDEICSVEHLHPQPLTSIYQQQQPHYQNQQPQHFNSQQAHETQPIQGDQNVHLAQELQRPAEVIAIYEDDKSFARELNEPEQGTSVIRSSPPLDPISASFFQSPTAELRTDQSSDDSSDDQSSLPPPPLLVPRHEDKYMTIQERLDYERALSRQRQERLKLQLEREPLRLPCNTSKKSPGKKMTSRERQMDLEKQEVELTKQRDRYVDMIGKLEVKCQRLRELLGDIVINSPEYNSKLVGFLESDDLSFIDSHINGLAD